LAVVDVPHALVFFGLFAFFDVALLRMSLASSAAEEEAEAEEEEEEDAEDMLLKRTIKIFC
jgi:hypothetical protein